MHDLENYPRHKLRAQSSARYAADSAVSARRDSITRSSKLLNYLSKAAAQAESSLFRPAAPDFAIPRFVDELVAAMPRQGLPTQGSWAGRRRALRARSADQAGSENHAAKAEPADGNTKPHPSTSAAEAESLLGRLADSIASDAEVAATADVLYEDELAISVDASDRLCQFAAVAAAESVELEDIADLSGWFGDSIDPAYGGIDYLLECHSMAQSRFEGTTLPAALPPVEDYSELLAAEPPETASTLPGLVENWDSGLRVGRTRRNKNQYSRRVIMNSATISVTAGGERVEKFFNGAQIRKDVFGRVTNVRSPLGCALSVSYDRDGTPQSFLRTDRRGHAHSTAVVDSNGVIVRDAEGRVKANGDVMSVDPSGCLAIRRMDGQFWSLDLVRQLHMERRTIVGPDGAWNLLTAVFCADGFRMVTRFQSLATDHLAAGRFSWLSSEPAGIFRFYGRDGSLVQFESEDDLIDLKPAAVWAPGSKHVDSSWRMHHQAGTAWESVQEYIVSYLSS